MRKIQFTLLLCLCISITSYSQQNNIVKQRKNAIGISVGTGFGLDYSRKINSKLHVTFGYNSLAHSIKDIEQEISGENLLINSKLNFKNVDLKISYLPFSSSSFKLIAGVGFFSKSEMSLVTNFKDNLKIGDIVFTAADKGKLDINFNWAKTAPYIGLGFGRPVPKKRLGFSFEVGTYISDSPIIKLNATGIIEDSKDQEPLLNNAFKTFKYLPYLSFRLSYSI